jgi:propionate CoA-transferase
MSKPKFITADQAALLIQDGVTLATEGFTMMGVAEEIYRALEARYRQTGHPRDLTLMHVSGQSDRVNGIQHFCNDGMLRRIIGSHWGLAPRMAEFIHSNKTEAYCFPQGQLSHLFRAMAARQPGLFSRSGLGTFVDPRIEGGKMNERTLDKEDLVELMTFHGEEYLFFKSVPIEIAVLRGTAADERGNVTLDDEAVILEQLSIAQATHNNGGIVIIQVKHIVKAGSLHPKHVKIPGPLVDYVVVAEHPEETHRQTSSYFFNPGYSGDLRISLANPEAIPLDARKVIGRRGAMELKRGDIVNVGTGIPGDVIGPVLAEENASDWVNMTVESGVYGGVPAGTIDFGISANAEAIIDHPYQFDFYNGGGLDITYMGLGQVDQAGNVNVSRFGGRAIGCGGFIDITQFAKRVCFLFTFTSGELEVEAKGGELNVLKEGTHKKFVDQVEQVTFSAKLACERNQVVKFITERAVFDLTENGLRLSEIAPGIDLERDIICHMAFRPEVADDLKVMSRSIFQEPGIGLRSMLDGQSLAPQPAMVGTLQTMS